MQQVHVETGDVVQLILQFLRENSLNETLQKLQNETGIRLNTVENLDGFVADIRAGRWDRVLDTTKILKLPLPKLYTLYEQVVIEMIELKEVDAAKSILRMTEVMASMKHTEPERYLRLERLLAKTYFDERDAYTDGLGKEARRKLIAQELKEEITIVPPSRLTSLIGQALKWQQHTGALPPGIEFDVFRNVAREKPKEEETYPTTLKKTMKFGADSHPECAIFSPDGQVLVTGSADGFIEVWDWTTGKLRKDLKYQAEDKIMMHNDSVLCLNFNMDSELLISGSKNGKIKLWRIATGKCLRRFEKAHDEGVTSLSFAPNNSHVLSSSFDTTIRIHGIKSGRTLKQFRGHKSYVQTACYMAEGTRIISGSADGSIRIWDARTTDCLREFGTTTSMMSTAGTAHTIHTIIPIPRSTDSFIVAEKSSNIYIMNMKGTVLKTFSAGAMQTRDYCVAYLSPKGKWLYCVSEDGILSCFNMQTGNVEKAIKVHSGEPTLVTHHPHGNVLATCSTEGKLKLWVATLNT